MTTDLKKARILFVDSAGTSKEVQRSKGLVIIATDAEAGILPAEPKGIGKDRMVFFCS